MTMRDLRNLTLDEMQAWMRELEEPTFRGQQVFQWVHGKKAVSLDEMTDLNRGLKQKLAEASSIQQIAVDKEQVSSDGTRKLRLRTTDDRLIETVLIPDTNARTETADAEDEPGEKRRLTQCISSQVGCAIDCQFCATAKLGFGRNLTAGEIVSQVYLADKLLASLPSNDPTLRAGRDRVTNLVFMGMGEPLHNYDNLIRALSILLHTKGRYFPRRRITVSTAGLVPAIERFAKEPVRVNLAVSLNATTNEQRDRIMPINRKYNLEMLLGALRRYPLEKKQQITFEYVLLSGVNDSLEDARRLPGLLKGIPSMLNLIPWNPHDQGPFQRPDQRTVLAFQAELMRLGMPVYIRKTRGDDIDAACGQLAAQGDPRAGRTQKKKLPVFSANTSQF